MNSPVANASSAPPVFGWAAFLGTSWTWCIGMFLPVLLVRDYGTIAWFIFAIPNVIGAAAMGRVLRQKQSEHIVDRHRFACRAFSIVTIAFHVFFAGWIINRVLPAGVAPATLLFVAAAIFVLLPVRKILPVSFVVWTASILAAGVYLISHDRPTIVWHPSPHPLPDLPVLAGLCLFGFALCPYLDLTFHSARRSLDHRGAAKAFALGFGLFFLPMIAFTLCYAPALVDLTDVPSVRLAAGAIPILLGIHLALQSAWTIGLHCRELVVHSRNQNCVWIAAIAVVALAAPASLLDVWLSRSSTLWGMNAGEILYRAFMTSYAVLFPGYVLLAGVLHRPAFPQSTGA